MECVRPAREGSREGRLGLGAGWLGGWLGGWLSIDGRGLVGSSTSHTKGRSRCCESTLWMSSGLLGLLWAVLSDPQPGGDRKREREGQVGQKAASPLDLSSSEIRPLDRPLNPTPEPHHGP